MMKFKKAYVLKHEQDFHSFIYQQQKFLDVSSFYRKNNVAITETII